MKYVLVVADINFNMRAFPDTEEGRVAADEYAAKREKENPNLHVTVMYVQMGAD